ncbi:hypothetical protein K435DRAFT_785306 [Dendrothele bispora CBS 962.96]|uniref:Uncharacterized protein n=1 Tax=Dendrothele bispora (strain CBS 962.96) TaxID=1314807 RepID=A0A4V4HBW2_DENBC|nr:hypothetical protein K435DRAFT_785306 [Dendrothele bispora CBS 962.96]
MDKLLMFSVHPASAKRQLKNHLQVPKPQILFFTYPVAEGVLHLSRRTCKSCQRVQGTYEEVYTLFKATQSQILS